MVSLLRAEAARSAHWAAASAPTPRLLTQPLPAAPSSYWRLLHEVLKRVGAGTAPGLAMQAAAALCEGRGEEVAGLLRTGGNGSSLQVCARSGQQGGDLAHA